MKTKEKKTKTIATAAKPQTKINKNKHLMKNTP